MYYRSNKNLGVKFLFVIYLDIFCSNTMAYLCAIFEHNLLFNLCYLWNGTSSQYFPKCQLLHAFFIKGSQNICGPLSMISGAENRSISPLLLCLQWLTVLNLWMTCLFILGSSNALILHKTHVVVTSYIIFCKKILDNESITCCIKTPFYFCVQN